MRGGGAVYDDDASAEATHLVAPRECTFLQDRGYIVHVGDKRLSGGMEKRYWTILGKVDQRTIKTLLAVPMAWNWEGGHGYLGKLDFRYFIVDLPEEEIREFLTGIGELAPTAPSHTIRPVGVGVRAVRPAS
jgi:hypothetical protein